MYIRFVCAARHAAARTHPGFFYASAFAPYARDREDWRLYALQAEIDWFNEHLAVPGEFSIRAGRHGRRWGVCWFRDSAGEYVSRARYASWLLSDLGVDIREIRTECPGTRVWEDDHQIVAILDRRTAYTVH